MQADGRSQGEQVIVEEIHSFMVQEQQRVETGSGEKREGERRGWGPNKVLKKASNFSGYQHTFLPVEQFSCTLNINLQCSLSIGHIQAESRPTVYHVHVSSSVSCERVALQKDEGGESEKMPRLLPYDGEGN